MNETSRNIVPGGYREMWQIAAPLILSMASFTIMQFCDRLFLARYSSAAIQAAIPAGMISWTIVSFFQTVASYSGTFTAQYHGAGNSDGSIRSTIQGLWLSIFSAPFILAMVPLGMFCLSLAGHDADVFEAESVYFRILTVWGILPVLGASVGGYFTGIGKTNVNMFVNIIGCGLNVILDYAMIFGKFGFHEMGVAGAAYATIISSAIGFILMMILFWREVHSYAKRTHESCGQNYHLWKMDTKIFLRILRFGFPSGLQMIMDNGCFAVFSLLIGKFGAASFAASNIAFSINTLTFAPLIGFGIAASTLVAQHLGGGRPEIAAKSGYTGLKVALSYVVLTGLSFVIFTEQYFKLFLSQGDDKIPLGELLAYGKPMMIMLAIWGFLDAINLVISGALKGAGDTKYVMLMIICVNWFVMLPAMLILVNLGFGVLSLWGALASAVFLCSIGLMARWVGGRWKMKKLI